MPAAEVEEGRLIYDVDGSPVAPPLLLLHSLGTTAELWSAQLERLAGPLRLVRPDLRGHGRSTAPVGSYTLDQLGQDALAVLDACRVQRAHVCGISLGGLVALWLAIHAASRVGRIVAANTAPRVGTPELWSERRRAVRKSGLEAISRVVVARWFTGRFQTRHPQVVERYRRMLARCPSDGYAGCCAALRDADLDADLRRIATPTLVVVGAHDEATPPAAGARIRDRVAGARWLELDAAHLSNVEQPDAFTSGLLDFLRD